MATSVVTTIPGFQHSNTADRRMALPPLSTSSNTISTLSSTSYEASTLDNNNSSNTQQLAAPVNLRKDVLRSVSVDYTRIYAMNLNKLTGNNNSKMTTGAVNGNVRSIETINDSAIEQASPSTTAPSPAAAKKKTTTASNKNTRVIRRRSRNRGQQQPVRDSYDDSDKTERRVMASKSNNWSSAQPGFLDRRALQDSKKGDDGSNTYGPPRFQSLPRSFASRIGFGSTLSTSKRRPQDLRFILAPHPRFPEIIQVIDSEIQAAVYRKVSRSSKSWHETFHEVNAEEEEEEELNNQQQQHNGNAHGLYDGQYGFAAARGISAVPYSLAAELATSASALPSGPRSSSGYTTIRNSQYYYPSTSTTNAVTSAALSTAASCATFKSSTSSASDERQQHDADGAYAGAGVASGLPPLMHPFASSNYTTRFSSTASIVNATTIHMSRPTTSMDGVYGNTSGSSRVPSCFNKGLLWEALTPSPNQFPLHIKDSRTVIDNVSLSSMVLDRHAFCYRFQFGAGYKMRWTAKRVKRHQLALQCYVRSTLIAEIFVDYEKGYSPYSSRAFRPNASSDSSEVDKGLAEEDKDACLPEDGTFPVFTILQTAFNQLANFDPEVVESFIIFTGMQMLECLHL
ncbi:hypothetical protein GGI12_001069 [Dipsacomyces acuminosporus]|nr:hypothetical protein GGI12_001069 [Dipsacomyces acuminosporus]